MVFKQSKKVINNTYLKIQIASSNKFLELKSYNFKGLTMLSYSYSKSRNSYKYYFENTQSYTQAKKYLLKAKRAGFKDAIIVAFDNGKKITLDQFLSRNWISYFMNKLFITLIKFIFWKFQTKLKQEFLHYAQLAFLFLVIVI